MTSLTVLLEAAKVVEHDKDESAKLKKPKPEREQVISSVNNRQTHNILEKNRRAELKNFFQRLKESVPKLREKPKASNVSILTEATKYINEMRKIDLENEAELVRLRRCRMCLEERVKMLKEEIHRQTLQKQLFAQVDEEKKRAKSQSPPPAKEMMSVEVQANEHDIRAAFPDTFGDDIKEQRNLSSNKSDVHKYEADSVDNTQIQSRNHRTSTGKNARLKGGIGFNYIVKMKQESSFCSPLNKPLQSQLTADKPKKSKRQHNHIKDQEETDSENELKIVEES